VAIAKQRCPKTRANRDDEHDASNPSTGTESDFGQARNIGIIGDISRAAGLF
jgi:hypothetical protein